MSKACQGVHHVRVGRALQGQGLECVALAFCERGDAPRTAMPFDLGATAAERTTIRNQINAGVQPQPIYGQPLFQYGFGKTTF